LFFGGRASRPPGDFAGDVLPLLHQLRGFAGSADCPQFCLCRGSAGCPHGFLCAGRIIEALLPECDELAGFVVFLPCFAHVFTVGDLHHFLVCFFFLVVVFFVLFLVFGFFS
jgi:hypothetical protein